MPKKILIVDDDEDLLEIMVERLKMRGLVVTAAGTAAEALDLLDRNTYDAIIIDFMLPGTDGLQAIKLIRKNFPDLRVILQTAYATVEKEKEALDVGAWGVIEKPADLDRLTTLIHNNEPGAG